MPRRSCQWRFCAFGLGVSVPLGAAGFWLARPLLGAMGAGPDVLAHASFTAILFACNGVSA